MQMASGEFLWKNRMAALHPVEGPPWDIDVVGDVIQEFVFYYPGDNTYTDGEGREILDIFDIISPVDLEMFKDRPYGHVHFLHQSKKDTLVEVRHIGPSLRYNPELRREMRLLREERGCSS